MTFKDIYNNFKDLVYNLALQYVCQVEDAEEITQDVFVKIYNHFKEFREESSLKTWIYRITINQSIDFIKTKNRNKRSLFKNILRFDDPASNLEIKNFDHPGIALENKEDLELLMTKIYCLPENQKTVIILLKIEDMTQKEVAKIMQLSEGAVESLFQRAKKSLRNIL